MILGTDMSIRECKDSGYTMIKYDGRKKYTHNREVIVFRYLPDYIRDEQGIKGDGEKLWTRVNTNDVWKLYQDHKSGIQSFADYHIEDINQLVDYYDLLNLADLVDANCGLDTDY